MSLSATIIELRALRASLEAALLRVYDADWVHARVLRLHDLRRATHAACAELARVTGEEQHAADDEDVEVAP